LTFDHAGVSVNRRLGRGLVATARREPREVQHLLRDAVVAWQIA
jgi:hypothetical protein